MKSRKRKPKPSFPPEALLVLCKGCHESGCDSAYVELDSPTYVVYPDGVVEYDGVEVFYGDTHGAQDPIPLTPAAEEFLKLCTERKLK